jgi:hypothetical protein
MNSYENVNVINDEYNFFIYLPKIDPPAAIRAPSPPIV